ncbi:MAG TPA: UDPGP type 1 family protein [Gemmataceae bacterium]|nr:UDPGP type 1 family protein [Gemmataceae bacterium]
MDLHKHLRQHKQDHLLLVAEFLSDSERQSFFGQLAGLDFKLLRQLYDARDHLNLPDLSRIKPLPLQPADACADVAKPMGETALHRGEVAVLMVAGGQGTRLRCDQPKGMFEIGPVSNKTLFQIHAEKVLARSRRHRGRISFLIMTSPATHAETTEFFRDQDYFGLRPDDVYFFSQGTMPALDLATGRLMLDGPGRLALGPDGHGGTLAALHNAGLFSILRQRGVRHIFYFQVDNPLVKVADPLFLGQHIYMKSQVSSKVTPKLSPKDKVGNFVLDEGRCTIIEYIHLPEDLAAECDGDGRLRFRAGNPAIHVFDLDFLESLQEHENPLPFHPARKKLKHWCHQRKTVVEPEQENALKFEKFIFDVLPKASRWLAVETTHREEFAPLKNLKGPDSPTTVRKAMSDLHADWLEQAGVSVPYRRLYPVEVSPLFALDAEELADRIVASWTVPGAMYLTR